MSEYTQNLRFARADLQRQLDRGAIWVAGIWTAVEPLIDRWWMNYKLWEQHDTFNKAFSKSRMSVRTFGGGVDAFKKQVAKKFNTINAVDTKKDKDGNDVLDVRIFADNKYTRLSKAELMEEDRIFHQTEEHDKYLARRGIDSSAFANPANFATHAKKYQEGLHDLSASLLNPKLSIFQQIHNKEEGGKKNFEKKTIEGAHLSFLPLSKEEDQQMLHNLDLMAKQLREMVPALQVKVRGCKAAMTRVKLAQEYDMGVGYSAIKAPKAKADADGYRYKLRYGLVSTTTVLNEQQQSESVWVDAARYACATAGSASIQEHPRQAGREKRDRDRDPPPCGPLPRVRRS